MEMAADSASGTGATSESQPDLVIQEDIYARQSISRAHATYKWLLWFESIGTMTPVADSMFSRPEGSLVTKALCTRKTEPADFPLRAWIYSGGEVTRSA
jgi:hypothetical protein